MTTTSIIYEQIPATRHINSVSGDDLSIAIDFDIDLSGYTFFCKVGSQDPTITVTNAALGQVTIALTNAQTTAIGVNKVHWHFGWISSGKYRTVLAGNADFIAR